jgi:hypothetical protein
MVEGKLKKTQFHFGPTPNSLWILKYKIQKQIQFKCCLSFNGIQTFWEKSINSQTFFLDMILNTVNLYDLTCIKKFEVPLQVENRCYCICYSIGVL